MVPRQIINFIKSASEIATAMIIGAVMLTACDDQPKEQAEQPRESRPQAYSPTDEWIAETVSELLGEGRAEARAAAGLYAQGLWPSWGVRGITSLTVAGNFYLVGVDITSGGEHRTLNLVVRLYFTEGGDSYWKAEPLTEELAAVLSGYQIGRLRRAEQDRDEQE